MENIKIYDDNPRDDDPFIVAIYLRSDKKYDVYSRQVTDILTFMGDIGGLSEALLGIGMLAVGFFSQKMFMSKIVRKIYHIRKYESIESEKVALKRKREAEVQGGPSVDIEGAVTRLNTSEKDLLK